MTSKMTSKLNPAAPAFVPSFNIHTPISTKKTSKPKYRSRNGELWQPPKGWLDSYRCAACRQIMARKEPYKCPQRINTCGHITCAKCIVTSYLVELNPLCPVEGCGKCVNPKQKERVSPVDILTGTNQIDKEIVPTEVNPTEIVPTEIVPKEVAPTECGFCGKESGCQCNQEISLTSSRNICYCYCEDCDWDCGTLWCGCIDVCRGRCGLNDRLDRW